MEKRLYTAMINLNHITKFMAFGLFLLLFSLNNSLSIAGPLPKPTDKLPVITSIESDSNYVWFAGEYHGGLVLRFNKESERWDSFYYPYLLSWSRMTLTQTQKEVHFFIGQNVIKFDKKLLRWIEEKRAKAEDEEGMRKYGITHLTERTSEFEIKGRTFVEGDIRYVFLDTFIYKVENERVVKIFELPILTTEMLLEYRPDVPGHFGYDENAHELSDVIGSIENRIGPFLKVKDRVWFGFDFYEGEGWEGVGGLGFFDLKSEKIGLYRLPSLRNCSVSTLAADGEWLWTITMTAGEYGAYGCSGLVKFNTNTGDYLTYEPPFQPSGRSDLLINSFHKINDEIWMATPYGITRYDEVKKTWKHYTVDKVKTKEDIVVFAGINPLSAYIDKLPAGEYELIWVKDDLFPYFEIKSPFKITGWIKKEDYHNLDLMQKEKHWEEMPYIGVTVYSEPDILSKVVGFLIAAPVKRIDEKNGLVKTETDARWVNGRDINPQVSVIKSGKGGKINKVKGEGKDIM